MPRPRRHGKLDQKILEPLQIVCDNHDVTLTPHDPDRVPRATNVLSFAIEQLQIDLICRPREGFEMVLDYLSWNDLGNLIGKVAHKLGVKFGVNGLVLIVRDGAHKLDLVTLSQNIAEILPFLGYDYSRWRKGFDTLEDIFTFAASTPYFNREIYQFANHGHKVRRRDEARPNYQAFLQWIESQEHLPAYPWSDFADDTKHQIDGRQLANILHSFPQGRSHYEDILARSSLAQAAKALFNGDKVKAITGLEGPALGVFISSLQAEFQDREALQNHVLALGEEEVRNWVMAKFEWHQRRPPTLAPMRPGP